MGEILNGICWDHHWFGFWREEGPQFAECPSIREWVNESWWSDKDVQEVASYLSSAPVVVAGGLERCLICGQVGSRGVAFRTDGDWYWSDTLAHDVLAHGSACRARCIRGYRRRIILRRRCYGLRGTTTGGYLAAWICLLLTRNSLQV